MDELLLDEAPLLDELLVLLDELLLDEAPLLDELLVLVDELLLDEAPLLDELLVDELLLLDAPPVGCPPPAPAVTVLPPQP